MWLVLKNKRSSMDFHQRMTKQMIEIHIFHMSIIRLMPEQT
jgi:hypothetical protein